MKLTKDLRGLGERLLVSASPEVIDAGRQVVAFAGGVEELERKLERWRVLARSLVDAMGRAQGPIDEMGSLVAARESEGVELNSAFGGFVITEPYAHLAGKAAIDAMIEERSQEAAKARGWTGAKPIFGPFGKPGPHVDSWEDMMPEPCWVTFTPNTGELSR